MSNAELIEQARCICGDVSEVVMLINGHRSRCPRENLMVGALADALQASEVRAAEANALISSAIANCDDLLRQVKDLQQLAAGSKV